MFHTLQEYMLLFNLTSRDGKPSQNLKILKYRTVLAMRGIPLLWYTTPSMVEKRPSTITMYLALPVEERRETPIKKPPKKQKFVQSRSFRPRRQRPDTTNVRGRPLRLQCRGRRGRPHPPHRPPRPRLSTLSMPHRSSDVEFSFLLKKIFPLLFYLNKNASLAI